MELVPAVSSNAVLSRVNPPYCPEKHPHGTSRPRVSLTKQTVRSTGSSATFPRHPFSQPAPIARATAQNKKISRRFMRSVKQRVGENVYIHLGRVGDFISATATAALRMRHIIEAFLGI